MTKNNPRLHGTDYSEICRFIGKGIGHSNDKYLDYNIIQETLKGKRYGDKN